MAWYFDGYFKANGIILYFKQAGAEYANNGAKLFISTPAAQKEAAEINKSLLSLKVILCGVVGYFEEGCVVL